MCTFVYETFNFTLNPHPNTVARFSVFCGNTERKPFPGLWVFVGNTCVSATLKLPDCPQFSGNDHVSFGSNFGGVLLFISWEQCIILGRGAGLQRLRLKHVSICTYQAKAVFMCAVSFAVQYGACSEGTGGKGLFAKSRKGQTSHCDFLLQQFVYVAVLTV